MLVKLIDEKGNVFTRVFPVELPVEFDVQNFNVERLELAKEFVKPYPGALAKLASGLISTQIHELEKAKALAEATLDSKLKSRFISDYNASTAKRFLTLKNLHPKARAYRTEKGLDSISLDRFIDDFMPMDADGKKIMPFKYITIEKDDSIKIDTPSIEEVKPESSIQAIE
jgi:hypothetical protein